MLYLSTANLHPSLSTKALLSLMDNCSGKKEELKLFSDYHYFQTLTSGTQSVIAAINILRL